VDEAEEKPDEPSWGKGPMPMTIETDAMHLF
jgi:hypothetical protein